MSPGPEGAGSMGSALRRSASGLAGPVPEWIRRLQPPVPPEVAVLLVLPGDVPGEGVGPSTEMLAEGAVDALDRALAGSGSRDAAWHLLGADALLTCACETALERPRADGTLEALIRRVLVEPDGGKEAGDRD